MTDPETIDRRLALARGASWAPSDAKARVRANLAASGVPGAGSSADAPLGGVKSQAVGNPVSGAREPGGPSATSTPARTGSVTPLTTSVLIGVSFVAGYWLGVHRGEDERAPGAAAPLLAASARATSTPPSLPQTEPEASGTRATRATVDATAFVTPETSAAATNPAATLPEDDRSSRAAAVPKAVAQSSHAPRSVPRPSEAARAAAPRRAALSRLPTPAPDPFGDEVSLLQRAERAIRLGEAPLALSFLDELDRRFPQSTLSEERSAARVLAECALAAPDARRRAELFLRDREASVYSDRVRRLCGLERSTSAERAADGSESPGH